MNTIPYEIALLKTDQFIQQQSGDQQMVLQPFQYLTKFIVYPGSDKFRTLIKHGTGLGKTMEALSIAQNFIKRKRNVTILTFNEAIFINEMLKFPQLGYISFSTKEKLNQSKQGEQAEYIYKNAKKEALKDVNIYGYKEFQNMIFWKEDQYLRFNMNLLEKLYDSVIICDEIHDVYNSEQQNTWGKTIQLVSNILQANVYIVFMSATPLNNPEEIDDLLNLMSVQDTQYQRWPVIRERAQNINLRSIDDIQHPIQMEESQIPDYIQKIMKNKVSFVPESQQQMPIQQFKGIKYNAITNIQLVPCIQTEEFLQYYDQTQDYLHDEEWRKHICFNFPQQQNALNSMKLEQFFYEYKRKSPSIIQWSRENNVQIQTKDGRDFIDGNFLKLHSIGRYSPKFKQLVQLLLKVEGKSFIYINGVKNVGVDLIQNLLRANGIIGEKEIPSQDTICFICRNKLKDHSINTKQSSDQLDQKQSHQFTPYRFIAITGKTKSDNERMLQLFNNVNNSLGQNLQVIIGSKIIKQGFNILATNNTFVLSLPFNVPNLIQVLGRNARTKSHSSLPADKQYVDIYILITASQDGNLRDSAVFEDILQHGHKSQYFKQVSREEVEYYFKFVRYAKIQQYEKLIHQVALDPEIYGKLYFNQQIEDDELLFKLDTDLKMKPFKPQQQFIETKDTKYDMQNYYKLRIHHDLQEVLDIIIVNKFKQQQIWFIDELIQEIQKTQIVPNPLKMQTYDIYFAIMNHENIHTIGNYVIKTAQQLDVDWFMPQEKLQWIKKIYIQSKQQHQIHVQPIVQYIRTHFKQYCEQIEKMQMQQLDIKITDQHAQQICKQLYQYISNTKMIDLEQYLMQAIDQNDVDLMIVLFLVFVPVRNGDIFNVADDKKDQIIGFVGENKSVVNVKQEDAWLKTKFNKQILEYYQLLGILTRKQFKLIQQQKQNKKDKDKRYEFQGMVCDTMSKIDIKNIIDHFQIDISVHKKKDVCKIIQQNFVILELNARLGMLHKKYLFFDLE